MRTTKYHPRHTRAYARHQQERARKRAEREWERMFGKGWRADDDWWTEEQKAKWIAKQAVDRKRCSCYVCTRNRKYVGPSLAEVRLDMHDAEEDRDVMAGEPVGEPGPTRNRIDGTNIVVGDRDLCPPPGST